MKTPILALLAAVTILNTVGCGNGTPRGYDLSALFTSPRNLKAGDPVIMAGVQIGRVEFLRFDSTNALTHVLLHIERLVVVKTDSTALIHG